MAIYYLDANIISRKKSQSAVACSAYRAAEKLHDKRYKKIHDYERKGGVEHTEVLIPQGAPEWMSQREKLWNEVEETEKRQDAQLAREVKISLPRELTLKQNIMLTQDFVSNAFVAQGMIADVSIHVEKASDGGTQPHAHVMLTQREILANGFGKKVREWNKKENLLIWRKDWAAYANRHLALHDHDMRIDNRTLKEQGIDLLPQNKIGHANARDRMEAYKESLIVAQQNGEKLIEKPEIILDVLINQQSTFTHHDIARTVDRYTVDANQFKIVYEKVKILPELVLLGIDENKQERFTTKGMLQLESEMIANALLLNEKTRHGIATSKIVSIEKYGLSLEQTKVLEHIVARGDLKNVLGYAGTGKSHLLGAAKELWEKEGYRVIGATLSGIAAQNLEASSGIESLTLASRMYYWDKGEELLTNQDILVVDEAGLIGSRQMAEILDQATKQGAKVVLMGDPEQLQAIQAGAAFRSIAENTSSIELTEIWRQKEDWQKAATIQFATQKTSEALEQYAKHGLIHEYENQSTAIQNMVSSWNKARLAQPQQSQIMLSYTRDSVKEINEVARNLRLSLKELGNDSVIQTERGDKTFAENDRIYFLKNDRQLKVKNGSLGTIVNINKDVLTVKIDQDNKTQPRIIQFSTQQYNQLDYGYAATIHKSQGVTVDQSFILASPYLDRHASYVAMTRHKENAEIFWSKDKFPSYEILTNSLSRERSKDISLDYKKILDTASFAAHRGMDTLWDNFLEKCGSQWLEKVKHSLTGYVDVMKDNIKILQTPMHELPKVNRIRRQFKFSSSRSMQLGKEKEQDLEIE